MAVIVSVVEADLAVAVSGSPVSGQVSAIARILDSTTDDLILGASRVKTTANDYWQYAYLGGNGTFTGGNGVVRLELTENGSDIDYEILLDSVSKVSGTMIGANDTNTADQVGLLGASTINGGATGTSYNYNTYIITRLRAVTYPWDDAAELNDWSELNADVTGGYLTWDSGQAAPGYTCYQAWVAPPTLSACLVAPGIYRRAVESAGSVQTFYESSGGTPILSGSADLHPELLPLNASGAALALTFQRGANTCYAIGGGNESAGAWGTVQTIAADRTCPTACVLEPSHDLFVVDVDGSTNIAWGRRLSWNGTSFDIGTEGIVSSGDVAAERGQVLWSAAKGRLYFSYPDTSGVEKLLVSDNAGLAWA